MHHSPFLLLSPTLPLSFTGTHSNTLDGRFPICFLARRFGEQTLLKVAHAFEKIHDKGVGKMYKVPETDLKAVIDAKRTGRKDLKL